MAVEACNLYALFVCAVCMRYLYALFVRAVCMHCLYALFVRAVCTRCLYALFVCAVCMRCLYALFVRAVCMRCLYALFVCVRTVSIVQRTMATFTHIQTLLHAPLLLVTLLVCILIDVPPTPPRQPIDVVSPWPKDVPSIETHQQIVSGPYWKGRRGTTGRTGRAGEHYAVL
jgi:hypothetical protein